MLLLAWRIHLADRICFSYRLLIKITRIGLDWNCNRTQLGWFQVFIEVIVLSKPKLFPEFVHLSFTRLENLVVLQAEHR
jgi:hypothetical protein